MFTLARDVRRQLPTCWSDVTHETYHPSVLCQTNGFPIPGFDITAHPELIQELTPLEEQLREQWPYDPNSAAAKSYQETETKNKGFTTLRKVAKICKSASDAVVEKALHTVVMTNQEGYPVHQKTWIAKKLENLFEAHESVN
jgi:hypothetical protein